MIFPPHCDSLGPRNGNPPSLLNRTTLGAAYSLPRRRILASRSCPAPSRLYYPSKRCIMLYYAVHGPLPRKHIFSICRSYSGTSAVRLFVNHSEYRHPFRHRHRYSSAPRVRRELYSNLVALRPVPRPHFFLYEPRTTSPTCGDPTSRERAAAKRQASWPRRKYVRL